MGWFNKKYGPDSKLGKGADKVARAVGGGGLVDYMGGRGSKKNAVESAAKVASVIFPIGGIGIAAKAANAARKAAPIGTRLTKQAGVKVKHWMDNKRGMTIPSRGNHVGRSGTSYKPYR